MGNTEQSSSELKKQIDELWNALAGNPHNRALVIARIAINHADEELIERVNTLIADQTPESNEKRQALSLLTKRQILPNPIKVDEVDNAPPPNPPYSPIEETPAIFIRVDPELGRLTIALHLANLFRIHTIARDMTRQAKGSGFVSKASLRTVLVEYGVRYTRRHFNRLLREGDGLFWTLAPKGIHIYSTKRAAKVLTPPALEIDPALLETNQPGVRDVYLSPSGSLEQWEAMIYAGWMTHRNDPTISRETLEVLFGRSQDTLRRWEQNRLEDIITIRKNYSQSVIDDELWDYFEGSQAYLAEVWWNGEKHQQIRLMWRMPNTYKTKGIRQHAMKGQASKVRGTVNYELGQPADKRRGGRHSPKLYFDSAEKLKAYVRKRGGVRYLWRGENGHGHGMFEPNTSGFGMTSATERADFKIEYAYFKIKEEKARAFRASYSQK